MIVMNRTAFRSTRMVRMVSTRTAPPPCQRASEQASCFEARTVRSGRCDWPCLQPADTRCRANTGASREGETHATVIRRWCTQLQCEYMGEAVKQTIQADTHWCDDGGQLVGIGIRVGSAVGELVQNMLPCLANNGETLNVTIFNQYLSTCASTAGGRSVQTRMESGHTTGCG